MAGDDSDSDTPTRKEFHHDPIEHATVRGGMTVGELTEEWGIETTFIDCPTRL